MGKVSFIAPFLLVFVISNTMINQNRSFVEVNGPDLKSRLQAAINQARSAYPDNRFWVAYAFKVRHGVGVDNAEPDEETRNVGIFLLYEPGGRSIAQLDWYNLDRPRDFNGQPVYWLNQAGDDESLDLLSELADSVREGQLYNQVIEAISLHESQRADAILDRIARNSGSKRERVLASYWLRERSSVCYLFKDMPGDLNSLSEVVRNERESMKARRKAAMAIGLCAGVAALPALQTIYENAPSAAEKQLALYGASFKSSKAAINFFIKVAHDESAPELRKDAMVWLGQQAGNQITRRRGSTDVVADSGGNLQEIAILSIMRKPIDEAVPQLINIVRNNPSAKMRSLAISKLSQTADPRALDFFEEVLMR
jgi:hypothetical protein